MSMLEHLSPLEIQRSFSWQRLLVDSVLALVSVMLVTGGIAVFHLYPRIPNISIVYLLVVLPLASTRGQYAAALAAIVAFLSFDFFIVPPLYTFVMYHVEEWIALIIFLLDALLTGRLASALRQRAQEASQRERETHTLYDLVRVANREEDLDGQPQAIIQALIDVFSPWGVRDCALLQPDVSGAFQVTATAGPVTATAGPVTATAGPVAVSNDLPGINGTQPLSALSLKEHAVASWVMTHGRTARLNGYTTPIPATPTGLHTGLFTRVGTWPGARPGHVPTRHHTSSSLHFLPLKIGQRVVGVLRLGMLDEAHVPSLDRADEPDAHVRVTFFWAFLDQVASLIERARLRREALRIELLQRTDVLRAALLSSVSHDLRTPLTAIKAAASSLLQDDVSWNEQERRSFASTIVREVDRLNRLVSNLLDLSRIEEGALKPQKEWYPLPELIREVLDRLHPMLQGRDVSTRLPSDLPPVELDYVQIDQVLTNLIENAIRYTPPQSPLEISLVRDGAQVVLQVADHGPGIPSEALERVFDKFYRVLGAPRGVSSPAGSGLGLAVCRGIIEAHGGRIWAQPRPDGGVIFCLTLPAGAYEGALL